MKLLLHDAAVRAKLQAGVGAALAEGGEALLSAARSRCPVETGRLRESGYVRPGAGSAQVGFTAPYAAPVHEKGSKFLEAPLNDSGLQAEILSVFARSIAL